MNFFKHLWHNSATDYRNEGEACLAHGDYDEAITDFNEAIHLDPKNVTAYLDRGLAYEEEGRYQEAISDFAVAEQLGRHATDDVDARPSDHRRQTSLAFAVDDVAGPGPDRQPELTVRAAPALILVHGARQSSSLVGHAQPPPKVAA